MQHATLDYDRRPAVVAWELTRACGLACRHCRADASPGRQDEELTTAEGRALLEQVATFGDEQLVVLTGGDPLTRPDLPELIEHGIDCGLRMTLSPSGTGSLTADRLAALADAGLDGVALSLDGPDAPRHDGFRGVDGSFERTREAAETVRELGLSLQLNTTVCAETVEGLAAMAELVESLDAGRWGLFFLVPVGRGAMLEPLAPTRADRLMHWLAELAESRPYGVKPTEAPQFRRVAHETYRAAATGARRRAGIRAGQGFLFVDHRGRVMPSGFLPEAAGSVRAVSAPTLYRESALFERLREDAALGGTCGACPHRSRCGGSRSRAYAHTGDPLAADPLCPFVPAGYDGPVPGPAHR